MNHDNYDNMILKALQSIAKSQKDISASLIKIERTIDISKTVEVWPCSNCKHKREPFSESPCNGCFSVEWKYWEAKDE